MSTSFSRAALPRIPGAPVTSLQYREMASIPSLPRIKPVPPAPEPRKQAEVEMTDSQLQALLAEARREGAAGADARLREELLVRLREENSRVSSALDGFERERRGYFARVETEVVRLALSIAAKILHRESQVDPMLVAALVQIAVGQLKENTAVTVRVHPMEADRWRAHFASAPQWAAVKVLEDGKLEAGDCCLETELGTTNVSLAAQLKEVEQGFFDVLAQTPKA